MKKKLLLAALCGSFSFGAAAQTLVNAGFETWQGPSGLFQVENPTGWSGTDKLTTDNATFLILLGITPEKQLYKSTDAHEGTFAVSLETKFLGDTIGNVPAGLVNAQLSLDLASIIGNPNPDFSNFMDFIQFTGGTPMMGKRADSITAWVKLTDQNMDNASIIVSAMQKVAGTDSMATIGGGVGFVAPGDGANAYHKVTVAVDYDDPSNTATDTLIVFFSSSAVLDPTTPVTEGNNLFVDDVALFSSEGTVSVHQTMFAEKALTVYPNPASDMIYFNLDATTKAAEYHLSITDVQGRVVYEKSLEQQINSVSVSNWTKGNYFYTLSNVATATNESGQFTIK